MSMPNEGMLTKEVVRIEEAIVPLSRLEKLQLIQFITLDLLKDERLQHFDVGDTHGAWGAYNEPYAAQQLLTLLEQQS